MKAKRLPSGNYRTQVVVEYDETGKRIVKSFTAETEWEALKLADDYKKGYVLGTKSKNMTVYQAFTQYIESRNNILSPSTIRGYRIIRDTRLQLIREMHITELKLSDSQP